MDNRLKRNANIELLRILSMLMVTMLHALDKGRNLVILTGDEFTNVNAWLAWILEAMSIGAVNIFILISGYFLVKSEFKLHRLWELVAQVMFYSIIGLVFAFLLGRAEGTGLTLYDLLHYVFPLHMDVYWFITAYVVLYMMFPIIAKGVQNITKEQYRLTLLLLIVFECVVKSVLPFALEEDTKGYELLWMLTMFLLGGYFRLYGFKILTDARKGRLLYLVSTILIFLEVVGQQHIFVHLGRLKELERISLNYNHLFVLAASVGVFSVFVNRTPISEKPSRVICALSPMALSVYLFQENVAIRYRWQEWLFVKDIVDKPLFLFLIRIVLGVVLMYILATLIDYVRIKLFSLVKKCFKNKW